MKLNNIITGSNATVHYIDYGNRETLPSTRLASLPAGYTADKPFATEYTMPYVMLPKDEEFAALAIKYLKVRSYNSFKRSSRIVYCFRKIQLQKN